MKSGNISLPGSHPIHVCDIVTNSLRACKDVDEHQHDEHEDIEKKLDIFHILNGILAKTRNRIS